MSNSAFLCGCDRLIFDQVRNLPGADAAHENGGHHRVELFACTVLNFFQGAFFAHATAVDAVRGHGVEGVGDGRQATFGRDLFALESVGVAPAVVAFVVVQDVRACGLEVLDALDHACADNWVGFDAGEFLVGEFAGFEEHVVGNGDFANVVHGAAEPDFLEFCFVPAEHAGQCEGVFGDAHGVALGVWVSGLNRYGEGGDDGAVADLEHFATFE
jgi:hypothetical protein